jgi:hypothetical protein
MIHGNFLETTDHNFYKITLGRYDFGTFTVIPNIGYILPRQILLWFTIKPTYLIYDHSHFQGTPTKFGFLYTKEAEFIFDFTKITRNYYYKIDIFRIK